MVYTLNSFDETTYMNYQEAIEENYQTALKYVDYEQRIVDTITNLFTENGILI